ANDRSAQPSYAHSTLTSARPMLPMASGPADGAVMCAAVAPWLAPSANDASTSSISAPNFAHVATPTMSAPTLAPRMFAAAANAPQSVTRPPPIQSPIITTGLGACRAMPAGDRKMPDPMVMPTTSATELHSPRVRGSLPDEVVVADAGLPTADVSELMAE